MLGYYSFLISKRGNTATAFAHAGFDFPLAPHGILQIRVQFGTLANAGPERHEEQAVFKTIQGS